MIHLHNTTIVIHAMDDHIDRVNNLRIVLKWIRKHIEAPIIVLENKHGGFDYEWVREYADRVITVNEPVSHSTRYGNMLISAAQTEVVAHWLHDVCLMRPKAVLEAERLLLCRKADIVYPFENAYSVEKEFHSEFESHLEHERLPIELRPEPDLKMNCGYIIMARKSTFQKTGGLNENFLEYGPIDKESRDRWAKLGLTIQRTKSPCLHLRHWRPRDDGIEDKRFEKANDEEYARIVSMSKDDLVRYIQSWPWTRS